MKIILEVIVSMFVLGLDFGTTTSCMSYWNDGVTVIPNLHGDLTTPSCITLAPEYSFGEPVHNAITGCKRLIGKTFTDFLSDDNLKSFFTQRSIRVDKSPDSEYCGIYIEELKEVIPVSYLIRRYISSLIAVAAAYTHIDVTHVVITVPAYYNDLQRQQMKQICESLQIIVLRMLNEPTAAALAYSHSTPKCDSETIMVVDCGGGTTDISVVDMDYVDSIYQVLSVAGDNFLGGEDVTHKLVAYFLNTLNKTVDDLKQKGLQIVYDASENIKKQLSYQMNASYVVDIDGSCVALTLSRAKFLDLNYDFFKRIRGLIEQVLMTETVDKVVLVGGSTRICHFKTIIKTLLGEGIPIYDGLDPDQTVSIGATVQGAMLCKIPEQSNSVVLDVTNMTLGVETDGGMMTRVISKNTTIPTSKKMIFTNTQDNIDNITIDIYQGERMFVEDNVKLASLTLEGLDKSLKAGEMHLHVEFSIDTNGIICVTAKDSKTNASISVCITRVCESPDTVDLDQLIHDQQEHHLRVARSGLYCKLRQYLELFYKIFSDIDSSSFVLFRLNDIFNNVLDVIINYRQYTHMQLEQTTRNFENAWHRAMLNKWPVITLDDIVLDIGSTQIDN
jgi:molecular chaperone DnaK (HSP70)